MRIEFFGDEIDTMRAFDPATQRTVESRETLTITPAREILPSAAEKAGLSLRDLKEYLIPLAYPMAGTMLDFLPDDTIIVLDGQEFIASAVMDFEEESLSRRDEAIQAGETARRFPGAFPHLDGDGRSLWERAVVELGYTNAPEVPRLAAAFEAGPHFAGKLRDFINYLQDLEGEGEDWTIVSRQSPRLRNLWREQQLLQEVTPESEAVRFIEGSLAGGWILNVPDDGRVHLLTDGEIFGWSRPQPRRRYRPTAEAPESIYADLQPGDWVVHVDHGIGKYMGLVQRAEGNVQQEYLCVEYAEQDQLFVPIHHADRLTALCRRRRPRAVDFPLGRRDLDFDQTESPGGGAGDCRGFVGVVCQASGVQRGYAFSSDTPWQREMEASFPHIETDDQLTALEEIKGDMEANRPMDRLLCGDVGYGKTEVTLRAAFKAVMDGKQVAVLVPTTVLAQQHYDTFSSRLAGFR